METVWSIVCILISLQIKTLNFWMCLAFIVGTRFDIGAAVFEKITVQAGCKKKRCGKFFLNKYYMLVFL